MTTRYTPEQIRQRADSIDFMKGYVADESRMLRQAASDAERLDSAETFIPRKQTFDDYGSGSDEQNMDLGDLMHMRGWNDCLEAIDAARNSTKEG